MTDQTLSQHGPAFVKMHGLGNDFVVFDLRREPVVLSEASVRAIADRRSGVGCDQLITIAEGEGPAHATMGIFNADGSRVGACGNASRCVAALLMEETGRDEVVVQTAAGLLRAIRAEGGAITVDMGPARVAWDEIPLAQDRDTLNLPVREGPLEHPTAVSMGNPHAVFFVDDAEAVDLPAHGPRIETHPMFPERTNVEVAQVLSRERIRMRVWERGSGITQACGTGACAALVAASRRGLTGRRAEVVLDGGPLMIEWRAEDGHVLMTGPVAVAFLGILDRRLLR